MVITLILNSLFERSASTITNSFLKGTTRAKDTLWDAVLMSSVVCTLVVRTGLEPVIAFGIDDIRPIFM